MCEVFWVSLVGMEVQSHLDAEESAFLVRT